MQAWMIERGKQPGLALEAREPLGIEHKARRQYFDRDVAVETCVAGAIDVAHAAAADASEDLVLSEPRARLHAGAIIEPRLI